MAPSHSATAMCSNVSSSEPDSDSVVAHNSFHGMIMHRWILRTSGDFRSESRWVRDDNRGRRGPFTTTTNLALRFLAQSLSRITWNGLCTNDLWRRVGGSYPHVFLHTRTCAQEMLETAQRIPPEVHLPNLKFLLSVEPPVHMNQNYSTLKENLSL
jgi:hypothetical protein